MGSPDALGWTTVLLVGGVAPLAALFLVELTEVDPRYRRWTYGVAVVVAAALTALSASRHWGQAAVSAILAAVWVRRWLMARERVV